MDTYKLEYPDTPESFDDSASMIDQSSASTPQPEQSGKKKRKAWGQPIPDFKVVLPPRKRAKTAEEKEQRKNERVIRNRKAADKSRQRQKAAVAELEVKTSAMQAEMAQLRAALTQYQTTFGFLPGTLPSDISASGAEPRQALTPATETRPSPDRDPPSTSVDPRNSSISYQSTPQEETLSFTSPSGPVLSVDSPRPSAATIESPSLAPSMFSPNDLPSFPELAKSEPLSAYGNFEAVSSMTQNPAAILCDPQCQLETPSSIANSHQTTQFSLTFSLINLTFLMTIYESFSTSMLTPMYQIFQILGKSSSRTSFTPAWMDQYFHLMHSLITIPSKMTTRPIFRMKLLSRLLACSPSTARLFEAATDRALRRLVDEEAILNGPEGGQQWASLLATKWAVQRLEREHQRYRLVVDNGSKSSTVQPVPELARQMAMINKIDGVDYVAVERSLWRWRSDGGMAGTLIPDVY